MNKIRKHNSSWYSSNNTFEFKAVALLRVKHAAEINCKEPLMTDFAANVQHMLSFIE